MNLGNPIKQGKVCDVYAGNYFLMERTDRFSVDDANLPGTIQYKGLILNQISKKWMEMTSHIVKNHLLATDAKTLLILGAKPDQIGRVVATEKCIPIPFEIIWRRYYIEKSGSWKSYKENGTICGINLPPGLKNSQELPIPIFTPSTKEDNGGHDVNISFAEMKVRMRKFIRDLYSESIFSPSSGNYINCVRCEKAPTSEDDCDKVADTLSEQIVRISGGLYDFAYNYAYKKGIILADTKLEFGLDSNFELTLIDEAFTPDSSRFWSVKDYEVGVDQKSMDKQYLRDYVHNVLNWHGLQDGPAPVVPGGVKRAVSQIYCDIFEQLFGASIDELTENLLYEWHVAQMELGILS